MRARTALGRALDSKVNGAPELNRVRLVGVAAIESERSLLGTMSRVRPPAPELSGLSSAGALDAAPQPALERRELPTRGRQQIAALQLAAQPGREERLLPGPNHRAVIVRVREQRAQPLRVRWILGIVHDRVGIC